VKLCNDILPTATLVHRSNPQSPSSCILCHHDTEDLTHLLQCEHSQRIPWRSKLYSALRDACDSFSTRESLIDVLIIGLDAWLSNETLDPSDFPPPFIPFLLAKRPSVGVNFFKADSPPYGRPSKTSTYKPMASTIPIPQAFSGSHA
jgi:hypothetical protein